MNGAANLRQEQLADDVRDNIDGQQAAAQFLERILIDFGDGLELLVAVESLKLRSRAYSRGFCRTLQKRLEREARNV